MREQGIFTKTPRVDKRYMWLTKKSPVDVNEEVLREYIQDLSKTIQTDQETYNYDKTGLTDNPGSKKS